MADKAIQIFRQQLFDEVDGIKFSKLKNKLLKKYASSERKEVAEIFMDYARMGKIIHWQNFLLTDIIKLVQEGEYIGFFEWTITVPALTYWGIDGLIKTKGTKSYVKLVELTLSETQPLSTRAKAIKSLSTEANKTFDRGLPEDPGYWKMEDLRLAEVMAWQKNGYKDGQGYELPKTHSSLSDPITTFEKTVAKLNKKLEAKRPKNEDLSNPKNWLVVAAEKDIEEIKAKWTLPEKYLNFLQNYSPLHVFIDDKKYFQGLHLYGASTLIAAQEGYAFNAVTNKIIADWPENFVVIADSGGDPYCIDIKNVVDDDAPIYTSEHGAGKWEFQLYAGSFLAFLKGLAGK